jgi:hypothetical protein
MLKTRIRARAEVVVLCRAQQPPHEPSCGISSLSSSGGDGDGDVDGVDEHSLGPALRDLGAFTRVSVVRAHIMPTLVRANQPSVARLSAATAVTVLQHWAYHGRLVPALDAGAGLGGWSEELSEPLFEEANSTESLALGTESSTSRKDVYRKRKVDMEGENEVFDLKKKKKKKKKQKKEKKQKLKETEKKREGKEKKEKEGARGLNIEFR